MSVPSTGHFEIELETGSIAVFDGHWWKSEDSELESSLNRWRSCVSYVHADVKDQALNFLKYARIENYRIVKIEYDGWEHDLPEGAID